MVWGDDNSNEQRDLVNVDDILDDEDGAPIDVSQELTLIQKKRMQKENEDKDMEMNIQSAGKASDLSPRQIVDLKGGYNRIKADQSLLPLQVKIRRSKHKKDKPLQ